MDDLALAPRPLSVDLDGLSLRLWDHGAGVKEGAPVVLFVHGYLDTGRSFDAVASCLRPDVRALCLDWRGHGQSDRVGPGGSYHLLDHVKDLCGVIRFLQRRGSPVDALVAHSMGGNVALMMAGAWPEIVPRLLVLDAFGSPSEEASEQPARLGRALQEQGELKPFRDFESFEAGVDRIVLTNFGLSRLGAERMARHLLAQTPEGRWGYLLDPRLRGPTPIRHPEAMWRAILERITGPLRLLRAERGYVPECEALEERLASCRDVGLRTLAGAHHHLHVDHPEEVAAETRAILSSG